MDLELIAKTKEYGQIGNFVHKPKLSGTWVPLVHKMKTIMKKVSHPECGISSGRIIKTPGEN